MRPHEHYRLAEQFASAAERISTWGVSQPTARFGREHHMDPEEREQEFHDLIDLGLLHAELAQVEPWQVMAPVSRHFLWRFGIPEPRTHIPVPVHRREDAFGRWAADRAQTPTAGSGGAVNRRVIDAMGQMQDNQRVLLSVVAEDAEGDAVTDPGTRSWSVDNPAIASLTDNGDGTQWLTAVGPVGTATVTVTDTEPSPDGGVTPGQVFQGSIAYDIVSGPVTEITIEAGTPENTPVPGDTTTGGPTPEESTGQPATPTS